MQFVGRKNRCPRAIIARNDSDIVSLSNVASAVVSFLVAENTDQSCSSVYRRKSGTKKNKGYTLIEVLIAAFVLAFSLLAIASFSIGAWRRTYDAHLMSLAVGAAANRAEAMRAGENGNDGAYHQLWQKNVGVILPQGQASYAAKTDGAEIKVCWQQLFRSSEEKSKFCYKVDL